MFHSNKLRILLAVLIIIVFSSSSFAANYTVTSGDSLFTISKLFNTSISKLSSDNKLTGSTIYPGQVLVVPASTYAVVSGDTLYKISLKKSISLYSLRKANNKWDNYLDIGQKLTIPATSQSSQSGPAYTQSEFDLLARLIMSEAEGQPYNAQVAVGAVVLNRVESKSFPNTIGGVIYQVIDGHYQFTPVKNGWINRPANETAKKAAYDALHGCDPSNGALFYFDDSATNAWLWSKPIAARIGNMVFVY